jgi:hypothetical protein
MPPRTRGTDPGPGGDRQFGPAEVAVDLVDDFAWPDGTVIRVIAAIDLGPGFGGPWPALGVTAPRDLDGRCAPKPAGTWRPPVRLQRPGRSVTAAVERTGGERHRGRGQAMAADLVVIGSRGARTIASMLLEFSVEVIDHAPAVLVARGALERLVVAWDRVTERRARGQGGADWPVLAAAEIHVVTVAISACRGGPGSPRWGPRSARNRPRRSSIPPMRRVARRTGWRRAS